jgi:hypothetical protein
MKYVTSAGRYVTKLLPQTSSEAGGCALQLSTNSTDLQSSGILVSDVFLDCWQKISLEISRVIHPFL